MKKPYLFGALAVIFAAALWGLDGVVLRPSLYSLDVSIVVFLEHFIAFALMFWFFIPELKKLKKLNLKDWGWFLLIAIFGGAIGTLAITKALFLVNFHHLSAIVILQKLQPLFAICLALIILKEKPKKRFYLWAFFALIGSYLITFGFKKPNFSGELFLASLLSLLAAFSFGSATVFGKRVIKKVNFRITTFIRFGLTSIIMILFILFSNRLQSFSAVTPQHIKILLIIVFTTGAGAIFLYYWGLKRVMASKATLYELAFPFTAIVLDYFINGELMSIGQFLGAFLIVFSIIKVVRLRNQ